MTGRTTSTTRPTRGGSTHPSPTHPGPGHPPGRAGRRHHVAERLAAALGRWYLDAQAGRVDVRRLRPLLTPTAEQRVMAGVLRARARHRAGGTRPGTRLQVRRVVIRATGDHFEALALVDDGTRTVAVTALLHPTGDGWLVSDLARPDDGLPALHAPDLT